MASERVVIAFAIGDPAGISPELSAKLLADPTLREGAVLLVMGDRRVLEMGAGQAGVDVDIPVLSVDEIAQDRPEATCFVDLANCDPSMIRVGESSAAGGASSLSNFRAALSVADSGYADAVFFTPFNKRAMRLARPDYVDETGFIEKVLGRSMRGSEFNVLDEVWNARVTSHVPLAEVAGVLSETRILENIRLTFETMTSAGFERPRIGVAALNPHAGDGGVFGGEDDGMIRPAVERAKGLQIPVEGPIPSDTVFVRALRGEFDAVLTMYHDQGQIAMKLIGFDRGVTLLGGYPFPIVTPAHGTAYDIAGKGIANTGAAERALALGARLAARNDARHPDTGQTSEIVDIPVGRTGLAGILQSALAA